MGEVSEAIIDGLFCEQCGELIDGEETGFPRKCGGCKSHNENKKDRVAEFIKEIKKIDLDIYTVKKFTPYHYRISLKNDNRGTSLDLYPVNKKYHIVRTDKKGEFESVQQILDKIFTR